MTNYIQSVTVYPRDNKNHKKKFSLYIYTKQTDAPVNLDNMDAFVARIDLSPFKKKKGKWVSEASAETHGLFPLIVPDGDLWGVLICDSENVSSDFNIDWEIFNA